MRPLMTGAAAGGGHLMEKQSSSSSLVPTAEELWKAWEIHCSILLSLFLQVFLFLFAGLRQRSSHRFLSNFLWLAYLSADAVAMFVLGHLAVRVSRDEPGHQLMSLWAPFVLVHLGGQDTITAFAKQDNELWNRHLLNLAIQAAVAGYVVAKTSWPDRRLRAAVALIFVSGFIKYAERTQRLYWANPASLKMKANRNFLWKLFSRGNKKKKAEEEEEQQQTTTTEAGKESREKTIKMMMLRGSAVDDLALFMQGYFKLEDDIIAVDAPRNLSVPAADQEDVLAGLLEGFLSREDRLDNAYGYVGALLGHSYRRLYTEDRSLDSFIHPVSTSIALALFVAAEKQQQATANSRVDIIVSYSLLIGALALDVSSAATFIFIRLGSLLRPAVLDRLPNCIQPSWRGSKKYWSQKLGQYSMVRSARMGSTCRFLGNDVKQTSIAKDDVIKKFILDTLLASGAEKKWAIASTRGRRALNRRSLHDEPSSSATAATTLTALKETITSGANLPTSVLILHIATDICYYHGDQEEQVEHKQISRQLSEYIMYLVFKCGVMFAFNSQVLHDKALEEIEKILSRPHGGEKAAVMKVIDKPLEEIEKILSRPHGGEKAAVMKLFEQDSSKYQVQAERHKDSEEQQATDSTTEEIEDRGMQDAVVYNDLNRNHMKKLHKNSKTLESPVLPRAREVAKELLSINNEAARWKLIVEVWAEMLYYVAPRCGGGFHYDRLSQGGEFVTHVLVLMYYLGPFMPPPDA